MDNTKKFTGLSKNYISGRPGYSTEFIEYIFSNFGISESSIIADIGSGTGKLTKQLLCKGCTVIGIEPNSDMRLAAESELCSYKNFISVNGNAEETTLENSFVNHITVAQAFHRFDIKSFKKECKRILKYDGKVFLIWNIRNEECPVNRELFRIFNKFCPEFKGFSGGITPHDNRIKEFFDNNYDFISFDNPLYFSREKFINRCLSGSYTLKQGDGTFNSYIEELNKVFDVFAKDGILKMENQTICYVRNIK